MKKAVIWICVMTSLTLPMSGAAGPAYLEELPNTGAMRQYRVTRVDISSGEIYKMGNSGTVRSFWSLGRPGESTYAAQCLNPGTGKGCVANTLERPGNCNHPITAAALGQKAVGSVLEISSLAPPPTYWSFYCSGGTSILWATGQMPVVIKPARASCQSSSVDFKMVGRVGDKLTDIQNVSIHCDSEASVKLTITDEGRVKVSMYGEVQLKFPQTGDAVRYVTGTDTQVDISAELTKQPPGAGTYYGSTILLLDVL